MLQSQDKLVVRAMVANAASPIIFALSNPTANTEMLPKDAVRWTDGEVICATGSPFDDVIFEGETYPIGQGNNAFVFPGLGFGSILAKARESTDNMVLEAAYALAENTPVEAIEEGRVYPRIADLQEVSLKVAARVMRRAVLDGVAAEFSLRGKTLQELEAFVRTRFWFPKYLPFRT